MKKTLNSTTYWDRFIEKSNGSIFDSKSDFKPSIINRHSFYIKLTDFFSPLYSIVDDNLIQLSGASYLYFKTLISFDKVIDKDDNFKISFSFLIHFQESVRILEKLFPTDTFWNKLYYHFNELSKINIKETKLREKNNLTESDFIKIAKGKSIMAYAIIDAIEILSDNYSYTNKLKIILDFIHVAFQIRDDIDDFKQDIEHDQYTLPIFLVENFINEQKLELNSISISHNNLYGSGIATSLIEKAISYYMKALTITKELKLDKLNDFLAFEIDDCKKQIFEINLIKQKSIQSNLRSKKYLFENPNISKETLIISLEKSHSFFLNNIENNGWSDFITSAGISIGWAQYFVCANLIEVEEIELVEKYFNINNTVIDSFNESTISDSDTLAFKIDVLKGLNRKNNIQPLIQKWKEHSTYGSWTTYIPNSDFINYLNLSSPEDMLGWTSYHKCVSSYSAYMLSKHQLDNNLLTETLDKLFENHNKSNLIESYWWSSPIYSTYYTLLSLYNTNHKAKIYSQGILENLLNNQKTKGSWADEFGNDSIFYSSMVIHLFIIYDFNKYSESINKGIKYLLKNQKDDGSWLTIPKLKIPSPNIVYPSEVLNWKKGSLGTNTIVDDHNRFFTASLVYKTLKSYYDKLWD